MDGFKVRVRFRVWIQVVNPLTPERHPMTSEIVWHRVSHTGVNSWV